MTSPNADYAGQHDLFNLHEGAERQMRVNGNIPKRLGRLLLDENIGLRAAVEKLQAELAEALSQNPREEAG